MNRVVRDEREKMIFWKSMGISFFVLVGLSVVSVFTYKDYFSDYLYCFPIILSVSMAVGVIFQAVNGAYFIEGNPIFQVVTAWLLVLIFAATAWQNIHSFSYQTAGSGILDRYAFVGYGLFFFVQAIITTYFVVKKSAENKG